MVQLLPPSPLGSPPGSGFWNDWYEKLRTIINSIASGFSWSLITGTPTTLGGYGITDAQSKLVNSAGLAAALSDETGTGLVVFNNTPSLTTPALGAATGTSLALGGGTALATTNRTGTGNLVLDNTPTLITPVIGAATGTSISLTGDANIGDGQSYKWGGGSSTRIAASNAAGVLGLYTANIERVRINAAGQTVLQTVGTGISIKEGTNAKMGTAILVAGTLVVSTTAVTATSRIFLTSNIDGGTPGFLRVSARTAGTSFTITSSNAADTSTIAWLIYEPS